MFQSGKIQPNSVATTRRKIPWAKIPRARPVRLGLMVGLLSLGCLCLTIPALATEPVLPETTTPGSDAAVPTTPEKSTAATKGTSQPTATPAEENIRAGLRPLPDPVIVPTPAIVPAQTPIVRQLQRPRVETTATLTSDADRISLFGVIGIGGTAAQSLQEYIASSGNSVTCAPERSDEHRCVLPNTDDVAMVALRNGAAQARGDAPEFYRAQEAAAQDERRGIWANLPPPPAQLRHPGVLDTATLQADGKNYRLDGLVGLSGQQARELQGYIRANGDAMMCQPREAPDA